MIQRMKGQVVMNGTYTLSSDGRALTNVGAIGGDPVTAQKYTVIFARQ
jgi:hypothetical protein